MHVHIIVLVYMVYMVSFTGSIYVHVAFMKCRQHQRGAIIG